MIMFMTIAGVGRRRPAVVCRGFFGRAEQSRAERGASDREGNGGGGDGDGFGAERWLLYCGRS